MYDISISRGKILAEINIEQNRGIYSVVREGEIEKAIAYFKFTGPLAAGDRVLLNTTAVELQLGTGGYHYIIANLDFHDQTKDTGPGHIMKLRYTPLQVRTLCVEEEDSIYHDLFLQEINLEGLMVIIIPLHSLLAPLALVFNHYFPDLKLVYIMTEGGSLVLEDSNLIRELKNRNLLAGTITPGHTFGGDAETVNIFTALLTAVRIMKADLIVVGMGPGMTGTGTGLGFSGAGDCFSSYATRVLGGKNLLVPRISLQDKRKRHRFISHHTITLLEKLILDRIAVVFPDHKRIKRRLLQTKIPDIHSVFYYPTGEVQKILNNSQFRMESMGRTFADDPLFFITGGLPVLHYKYSRGGKNNE